MFEDEAGEGDADAHAQPVIKRDQPARRVSFSTWLLG
jgi:hypothetical protein